MVTCADVSYFTDLEKSVLFKNITDGEHNWLCPSRGNITFIGKEGTNLWIVPTKKISEESDYDHY